MNELYDVCNKAGGMTAFEWERDPKRLAFILARYHFVARMLTGYRDVLEVGCADGFGTRLVREVVETLDAIDSDRDAIAIARANNAGPKLINFLHTDFFMNPAWLGYDAVYALDVLEHFEAGDRAQFIRRLSQAAPVAVIGTPSLESQTYASELSKAGHVGCLTEDELRAELLEDWSHVFLFGMNDTTLHVGFGPMCHYRLAVCVS